MQDEISPAAGDSQKAAEVPSQDEVSTAAEVTKGDSQKADNASVPDHLWLRACAIGYGDEACAERHSEALSLPTGDVRALGVSEPPAGWKGAIPGLRLFTLRYWRAHTTRGYIAWRKTNVPLPPGRGGQMVQYRWQSSKFPVYEWTGRGRRLYQAEWRTLRQATMPYIGVLMHHGSNGPRAQPPFFGTGARSTSERYGTGSPTS